MTVEPVPKNSTLEFPLEEFARVYVREALRVAGRLTSAVSWQSVTDNLVAEKMSMNPVHVGYLRDKFFMVLTEEDYFPPIRYRIRKEILQKDYGEADILGLATLTLEKHREVLEARVKYLQFWTQEAEPILAEA